MSVGTASVPTMRYGFVGSFGTVAEQVALAREVEAAGWDGYFTWDAISLGTDATWDPFALLGAVAASTERITLGALVFAVPRRSPWELARQALTVDHLSGGRLVLPMGVGVTEDRAVAGVSGRGATPHGLRERAALLDETLAILDAAAGGEPFSHAGEHYQVQDMLIAPRPVARPRVPIWPVGVWPAPKSMARAARWDGIVVQLRGERAMEEPTPDDVAALVAHLTEVRGGPEAMAGFEVVLQGQFAEQPDAAERAAAYEAAGATWWIDGRWQGPDAQPDRQRALVASGPPRT
ncbi:alkanesulfonate monooxygenase SsuD/methylene tetrahydromethanopterin reductase-like flavin-dependent oxidoreductase (luciferase family) [Serinibacter salmoneus]|uniref:Alkanesulfonate monooxygenase SsuD/methylene tetrahydromethanopterin reductase-like flavin-dependent oxidoreductase (Luciferase family) n=2 Tax=Serinibacter salmoneus TaxID=556530 RepID=A0A2A9D1A7_9MICO|nr:alkanesulfonate monooxygenase SsuD/methylene tetrahydromethanopterin reductase-like flavin-dependent oxidoreductase (luciferase family) [Serinibacter salmoneus]